jgi:SAM-dependent methyltransferase
MISTSPSLMKASEKTHSLQDELPFGFEEELPANTKEQDSKADLPPLTLVNSRPLEELQGGSFIAPYVPCNEQVIQRAFEFTGLNSKDVLLDLGCGDGRILARALQDYSTPPCKCIGVELDPVLSEYMRKKYYDLLVSDRLEILERDMFSLDLNAFGATVMILYLLPAGLDKLKSNLSRWFLEEPHEDTSVKKRIVTITYSIPGWEPVRGEQVVLQNSITSHWLFEYNVSSINFSL